MLNIICINRPKYIREEVDQYNFHLYICIICGRMGAGTSRYAPKMTKFITHICSSCALNKHYPKNVRMKRFFIQYYDRNYNLLLEKEFGGWPNID